MSSVKDVLNFIPKKTSMKFEEWEREHQTDLDNIFRIFMYRLKDVEPFNQTLTFNKLSHKLPQLLYKYEH